MKIIDAHIHFSDIESFKVASKNAGVDYSKNGFLEQFKNDYAIGMGVTEKSNNSFPDEASPNPMTLDLDENPKNMFTCLGFNPDVDTDFKEFESKINESVVGLKVYAGYYHYHVWDEVYHPIYMIAEKYNLPVVIHSGDTYSEKGLLKFSHPLEIDQLAVMFRNVNFVIAHFGDPWIMDAAEVAYKNRNVYIDLSGLIVGSKKDVERMNIPEFTNRIREGLVYLDDFKKVLYGSDWPLVDPVAYFEFIKSMIPLEFQEDVFFNNARKLFKKMKL